MLSAGNALPLVHKEIPLSARVISTVYKDVPDLPHPNTSLTVLLLPFFSIEYTITAAIRKKYHVSIKFRMLSSDTVTGT